MENNLFSKMSPFDKELISKWKTIVETYDIEKIEEIHDDPSGSENTYLLDVLIKYNIMFPRKEPYDNFDFIVERINIIKYKEYERRKLIEKLYLEKKYNFIGKIPLHKKKFLLSKGIILDLCLFYFSDNDMWCFKGNQAQVNLLFPGETILIKNKDEYFISRTEEDMLQILSN